LGIRRHALQGLGHFLADAGTLAGTGDGVVDAIAGIARRLGTALGESPHLIGDHGETGPELPARAASTAALSASRLV
jgi:hypothetical protein